MSRDTWPRTASSAVLAGRLDRAITGHTSERMRHFFLYLYTHRMIIDRLNTEHGQSLPYDFALEVKATHQVDAGMRSKHSDYYGFDSTDPKVIEKNATACGSIDAAHYCNLGISPALAPLCGSSAKDALLFDWYENLKVFSGNTRYMPQRINIGPDRVIDKMHGDLASQMLNGTPPISAANRKAYVDQAIARMSTYRGTQEAIGNHGIVACADVYLEFYRKGEMVETVWNTVKGNAFAECAAYKVSSSIVVAAGA